MPNYNSQYAQVACICQGMLGTVVLEQQEGYRLGIAPLEGDWDPPRSSRIVMAAHRRSGNHWSHLSALVGDVLFSGHTAKIHTRK